MSFLIVNKRLLHSLRCILSLTMHVTHSRIIIIHVWCMQESKPALVSDIISKHTPLHLAAINGHVAVVRLLLEKGYKVLFVLIITVNFLIKLWFRWISCFLIFSFSLINSSLISLQKLSFSSMCHAPVYDADIQVFSCLNHYRHGQEFEVRFWICPARCMLVW